MLKTKTKQITTTTPNCFVFKWQNIKEKPRKKPEREKKNKIK